MTKVVKVEEKETVLAGSGDGVGVQISDQGSNSRSGIRETTPDEVSGGAAFAKPFSPSFDDAE